MAQIVGVFVAHWRGQMYPPGVTDFFCVLGDRLYTCSSRVSALMSIILTHGALARRPGH